MRNERERRVNLSEKNAIFTVQILSFDERVLTDLKVSQSTAEFKYFLSKQWAYIGSLIGSVTGTEAEEMLMVIDAISAVASSNISPFSTRKKKRAKCSKISI